MRNQYLIIITHMTKIKCYYRAINFKVHMENYNENKINYTEMNNI